MVLWEETANPSRYTDLVDQMHPWNRSLSSQQDPHQGRRTGIIEGKGTSLGLLSRGVHHGCLSSCPGKGKHGIPRPSPLQQKVGPYSADPSSRFP